METETKQLADGRTVVVRPGIVGGVEIGNQLVMDGKIRTVTGRRTGPPLKGEWEKQVTLYFTDSRIGVRGDEAQTVYHLVESASPKDIASGVEIKTWGTEATDYSCTLVWQRPGDRRHYCRSHTAAEHLCPCGTALKISQEVAP